MIDQMFNLDARVESKGFKAQVTPAGIKAIAEAVAPVAEEGDVNYTPAEEVANKGKSMELFGLGWSLSTYLPKGASPVRTLYVDDAEAFAGQTGINLAEVDGVIC